MNLAEKYCEMHRQCILEGRKISKIFLKYLADNCVIGRSINLSEKYNC